MIKRSFQINLSLPKDLDYLYPLRVLMLHPQAYCYSEDEFKAWCRLLTEYAQNFTHSHTVHSKCVCFSVCLPPVIIFCQSHLLKVNVKPVAFRRLQDPVACQIVAVVARKSRRDDPAIGGIFYHSPTGCYMRVREKRERRQRVRG